MNVDFIYLTKNLLYCIAPAVTSDWIISLRIILFRPLHHFASRKRIEPADMTPIEACSAGMSLLHPCQSVQTCEADTKTIWLEPGGYVSTYRG